MDELAQRDLDEECRDGLGSADSSVLAYALPFLADVL